MHTVKYWDWTDGSDPTLGDPFKEKHFETKEGACKFAQETYDNPRTAIHKDCLHFVNKEI